MRIRKSTGRGGFSLACNFANVNGLALLWLNLMSFASLVGVLFILFWLPVLATLKKCDKASKFMCQFERLMIARSFTASIFYLLYILMLLSIVQKNRVLLLITKTMRKCMNVNEILHSKATRFIMWDIVNTAKRDLRIWKKHQFMRNPWTFCLNFEWPKSAHNKTARLGNYKQFSDL